MLKFLVFCSLCFITAQACAPGSGTLGSKANFAFEMIPPTVYTYSSKGCTLGQIDEDFASRVVKADVQNSINQVLQANSIPTNDVNKPVVNYKVPDVHFEYGKECTTEDNYIVIDEKAYYHCGKPNATGSFPDPTVFIVSLIVDVTAVQAIYESQWEALASQVQDKLTDRRRAYFYDAPTVTVS